MGKDIVKYRYIILIFFAILLAVSVAFLPKMISKVNYDLTSYLPAGYDTYDGYQFLSEKFNIHGDVEIGVEATYDEAKKVVDKITAIDGVTSTTWADMLTYMIDFGIYAEDDPDFLALRKVLTDSPTMTNDGQKHNWAVLVTLKYPPSSTEAIDIFQKIKTTLIDTVGASNYSMSGMTEQANALFETVFDEIGIYCIIAGIVVLFLLAITTSSLMEPIILLLTMVISILINLGTNVLFPSTSIITFACTAILQIGLSMDYALFLLHQYRTELTKTLDAKEALSKAIPKSAKAVAASALTTVGGFLALLCMKFGVGSDLGLSLAKGILCSLLTVLFLQPCLMLMFEKARVKTQHKCIDLHFKTPVKHSIKNRWPIAIAFVLLLVPMFLASNSLKYSYVKFLPPSTDVSAKSLMAQELGNQVMMILPYKGEINGFKVDLFNQNYKFVDKLKEMKEDGKISFSLGLFSMVPKDATLDKSAISKSIADAIAVESDEALKNQMQNMLDLLSGTAVPDKIPFTLALSMFNTMPKDVLDAMGMGAITSYLTDDGFTMYTVGINPKYDSESQESFNILDELKTSAYQIFNGVDNMKVYITGSNQGAYDFAKITPNDFMLVSLVSILAILVILIFTLGGIKFPVLLVILIEFGIWINLAMQYIFAGGAVNFMAYLIITAVQLGATVDYAILVSTKYRDLRKRLEPRAAAYTATTTSAMTILTSALIMAGACFSVFFVTTNLVIKEMTFLMARGSLISAALVIFVLPAILVAADRAKGNELHMPRTPKLRKYKHPSKALKASWKETNFGEIKVKPSKYSGMEVYDMMSNGVDITKATDTEMQNWLRKH